MNKSLTNIFYSTLPPIAKTGLMSIAGIIMAKVYGATLFGYFSFALALYYFLHNLAKFGLDAILPKLLIEQSSSAVRMAQKSFWFILATSVVVYAITVIATLFVFDIPSVFEFLILSICAAVLMAAFEVPVYWQQSKHETKAAGMIRAAVIVVGSLAKIGVALYAFNIVYIGLITLLEFVCFAFVYSLFFLKTKCLPASIKEQDQSADFTLLSVLDQAKFTFMMTMCYMLYTRVDIFMLPGLSNATELGTYALTARLSEMSFFIASATVGVMIPRLTHEKNVEKLQEIYVNYTSFMLYIAAAASVGALVLIYIFSKTLFSEGYDGLLDIGLVHVWSNIPSFLIISTGVYLISQNQLTLALYRLILIVVLNVGLNFMLIPSYGAKGAAIATLVAYSAFFIPLMLQRHTRHFTLSTFMQAINPKCAINFIRKV